MSRIAVVCVLVASRLLQVTAQIGFTAADFPQETGEFRRVYFDSSGISVAHLVGTNGGPQIWDFAYPRAPLEEIRRIEIVGPGAGDCAQAPAGAEFAEQITREASGRRSWEYYSTVPGVGRYYHGFCSLVDNAVTPGIVFDDRSLEFPECSFGTSWERTVFFEDEIDPGMGIGVVPVLNEYTSTAAVDAFGTLILPEIGPVPALRVTEINSTTTTAIVFGAAIPLGTQHTRNYSFLVPGIGRAVHIISKPSTSGPPAILNETAAVLRVFESSSAGSAIRPVENLRAELRGTQLFLSWSAEGQEARYVVAFTEALSAEPAEEPRPVSAVSEVSRVHLSAGGQAAPLLLQAQWTPFLTNANNFLFLDIPKESPQRFFRVGWFE